MVRIYFETLPYVQALIGNTFHNNNDFRVGAELSRCNNFRGAIFIVVQHFSVQSFSVQSFRQQGMVTPGSRRGHARVTPGSCHVHGWILPVSYHGFTTVLPRSCQHLAMVSGVSYGGSRRGHAVVMPWSRRGHATVPPCSRHGFAPILQGKSRNFPKFMESVVDWRRLSREHPRI